jgi:hypothetical protein
MPRTEDIHNQLHVRRASTLAPRRTQRRMAALAVLTSISLVGCGAGTSHHSPSKPAGGPTKSKSAAIVLPSEHTVIARVGDHVLTGAMLAHLISTGIANEAAPIRVALVPPSFSACVAKARQANAVVSSTGARNTCQASYEEDRREAITRWISGEWVIHGAEEVGVAPSDRSVHENYVQEIREEYKSFSEFEKYLAETGATEADLLRQIRVARSGEHIREKFKSIGGHVTQADVRDYYEAHRAHYTIPQRRDLEILRFKTKPEAQKAKREIVAGRTFASIAKSSTLAQPIHSKDGFVRGLVPGYYSEPPIDRAIFNAEPDRLGGPVKIVLGWYLFEVKQIHHGRRKGFNEVKSSIRQMLPKLRFDQTLTSFTSRWRAKWREKTDCTENYVVQKCKQFKSAPGALPEDPYTLA